MTPWTWDSTGNAPSSVRRVGGEDAPWPSWRALRRGPEHDDAAYRLTLMSVLGRVRDVVGEVKERRRGRILNLASLSVKQPLDGLILSNTVRAAVIGFAKTAATELYNVAVNNVCPGLIYTDRVAALLEERARRSQTSTDLELQKMCAPIPMGRLGEPEERANLVVFLTSERARSITGTTIQVDGGAARSLL